MVYLLVIRCKYLQNAQYTQVQYIMHGTHRSNTYYFNCICYFTPHLCT